MNCNKLNIFRFLILSTLGVISAAQTYACNFACDGQKLNLSQERIKDLLVVPIEASEYSSASTASSGYIQLGDMRFQAVLSDTAEASAFTGSKWNYGVVYYQFDSGVSELNKQRFRDAAKEWENAADLTFIEGSGIGNYIYVKNDYGNWSYVGMIGGRQEMGLYNWSYKYVIVHEIGHALGLTHEHSRSDRDQYVEINWDNIYEVYQHNFDLKWTNDYGEYDFYSVMHYSRYAFAMVSGVPTITPKAGYEEFTNIMGQRSYLSELDIAGMEARYGAPNRVIYFPSTVEFEPTLLGTERELTVTIQNKGDSTVSGSISIDSPFSITSRTTYSLSNGDTQTLTIKFAPIEEADYSEQIEFTSGESINVYAKAISNNDSDKDGATNYEEYIAGTDAEDPDDFFMIIPDSVDTNGFARFSIETKSGRGYQLQATDNLMYIPFYNVGEELTGDGSVTNLSAPTSFKSYFFRVQVNKFD